MALVESFNMSLTRLKNSYDQNRHTFFFLPLMSFRSSRNLDGATLTPPKKMVKERGERRKKKKKTRNVVMARFSDIARAISHCFLLIPCVVGPLFYFFLSFFLWPAAKRIRLLKIIPWTARAWQTKDRLSIEIKKKRNTGEYKK